MVFYCEKRAAGFCNDLGNQDEGYFDALRPHMFEQALKVIGQGNYPRPIAMFWVSPRLDRVRLISHNFPAVASVS